MNDKVISRSISVLVLAVSIIAFVLSYNALREVAANNGLADWRAYFWPLLIDFPLVVFSLAVLWANLNQMSARWPWFLVGLFTAATITFNLIHAPDTLIARSVAVVAPLALFLSFETLVGMIRNEIKRGRALASLGELSGQVSATQDQLATLRQQVKTNVSRRDNLQAEIDRLTVEADTLTQETAQAKEALTGKPNDTRQRIAEILTEDSGLSSAAVAGMVGVSAGRVRQLRKALNANGHGGK